jgi:hypothetical protein
MSCEGVNDVLKTIWKRLAVAYFKEFYDLLGKSEDKYNKSEDCRLPDRESKPGPPACQSFALLGVVSVAIMFDIITLIND